MAARVHGAEDSKIPKDEQALFEQAVVFIRTYGERRTFEPTGKSSVYFDIDGRQYWTMGAPIEETIIINRAWLDWRERLARGRGICLLADKRLREPSSKEIMVVAHNVRERHVARRG